MSNRIASDGLMEWNSDMGARFWIVIPTAILIAMVVACWPSGEVLAADDRLSVQGVSETQAETDIPDPDDASPQNVDKADKFVPQADPLLDLGGWVNPLLGAFSLVADVIEAVIGDEMAEIMDEDQIKAMILECETGLRGQLKAELELVRLICSDLNPEQRQKIRSAGEAAIKQASEKIVRQANQAMKVEEVAQEVDGKLVAAIDVSLEPESINVDPGPIIREAIFNVMKDLLPQEQMTQVTDEFEKRSADRKRAVILNVVSRLDAELYMSEGQRAEVQERITNVWKPSWETWLYFVQNGNNFFPSIPDECLVPLLSADQKAVWNGLQKTDFEVWQQFDDTEPNVEADEWWGFERGIDGQQIQLIKGIDFDLAPGPGNNLIPATEKVNDAP